MRTSACPRDPSPPSGDGPNACFGKCEIPGGWSLLVGDRSPQGAARSKENTMTTTTFARRFTAAAAPPFALSCAISSGAASACRSEPQMPHTMVCTST